MLFETDMCMTLVMLVLLLIIVKHCRKPYRLQKGSGYTILPRKCFQYPILFKRICLNRAVVNALKRRSVVQNENTCYSTYTVCVMLYIYFETDRLSRPFFIHSLTPCSDRRLKFAFLQQSKSQRRQLKIFFFFLLMSLH